MRIGLNIGHAHTKAIIINDDGAEHWCVFPSQITMAHDVAGAHTRALVGGIGQ